MKYLEPQWREGQDQRRHCYNDNFASKQGVYGLLLTV
jgi:hypothetical protein